ncbi:MAG: hypothetical protein DI539_04215 [Flavobacterium psychrophilum]|nr:MAG: hypothetical protein DI539_04215 [Flavobacterium psychrophilum]
MQPDFIATLYYRTTEEKGRATAAKSGYRPTVKFPFDKMMTTGIQTFVGKELVYPGESIDAIISILSFEHFYNRLDVGMEFIFAEGQRIIGTGVIKEILNQNLKIKK